MRSTRFLIAGVLLGCAMAAAQSTDASVSGTVTDPSGAHIPDVAVTALNVQTGVATNTATNAAGVYVFPALLPGSYRFTAEHAGFRKAMVSDVDLELGARITLNLPLDLGATSESVEVKTSGLGDLSYTTSSVGSVVSGRKILELPLAGRSTYDLVTTQAGVFGGNINGNRTGSLNITTDGINSQDNLLNGGGSGFFNAGVANQIRVDRVEEFRIITSPADAELGRGSGQVQVITRSGTNTFHGSLYEEHRNTVLTANSWFNNSRGNDRVTGLQISPRDTLIRNQYGGRLAGPIKRNRTFFSGNYEEDKQRQRNSTTATVYTESARQGLFRFFPGVQNGNANAIVPTVDLQGNPVQPATGALQTISVFGRDPNHLATDPSGVIAKELSLIPLPNNFRAGDGLNTAGYTWRVPVLVNFATYETRVDHLFSPNERMSVSFDHQAYDSKNVSGPQPLPSSPGGRAPTETTQYSASLTSVLRPNLLNEFRAGVFRPRTEIVAPYDPKAGGPDILSRTAGGQAYLIDLASVTEPLAPTTYSSDNSNRISPVYQWGDNLSWLKGRHAFKGGVEVRFVSSAGYDAFAVQPRAVVGAGFVPVQNITTIPGIVQNSSAASNLLLDLSGTFSSYFQVNNSPGGVNPVYVPGETRYRNWSQHEYSWFFKDDWKLTPNLTLNLGVRYEWYAVPHERQGKALAPVGGSAGLFGISGTSFADIFKPGASNGSLTRIQLISSGMSGPGTSHPDVPLYNNDNNNFAPAVGLAWSLPWFGKDKTTLRLGYGIGYERNAIYVTHNVSGLEPGLSETTTIIPATLTNATNLKLPAVPAGAPLATIPLTARTAALTAFDSNLRNPYIQNWNLTLTRALPGSAWLDVRYVGSKGTKLVRGTNVNEVNIFENGILDAFRITQAGGNSPLLDTIFRGLPGVTGSGSDFVRASSNTQGFFANNDPAGFASFLSNTNTLTGVNGGLLRRVGLPENLVVANPQVSTAVLTGNFSNSSYHSLQVEYKKRLSSGWIIQSNYTWSRTLGDYDGEDSTLNSSFRTLRNEHLDKKLLSYNRSHVFRTNGIWELPFGSGKTFGRNAKGVFGRIIEGWQMGAIFNVFSGSALSFSAANAYNTASGGTPVIAGAQPVGGVQKTGNGVVYFSGLKQVVDPYVAGITTLQGIQGRSSLKAIADASGNLLLVNPQPGQFGTLGQRTLFGPGRFRLDINLIKRIRVTERIGLDLRADAINFTNTPQFGDPDTNINSLTFGRINGLSGDVSNGGTRIVVLQMRLNF